MFQTPYIWSHLAVSFDFDKIIIHALAKCTANHNLFIITNLYLKSMGLLTWLLYVIITFLNLDIGDAESNKIALVISFLFFVYSNNI